MSTTTQLSGIVVTTASSPVLGATITWSSLTPSIATVSSTGLVTPVSAGVATIRATYGTVVRDTLVTVRAAAGPAIYLFHTFTAPDSTTTVPAADTGQATIVLRGTGGIASNQFYAPIASDKVEVVWDAGQYDGVVTLQFTTPVGDQGICFRAVDTNNAYRFVFSSGSWYLQKKVASAEWTTTIASAAGTLTAGDTGTVTLNGSSISCAAPGLASPLTTTDAFNATATRHGVSFSISAVAGRADTLRMTA